MLKWLKKYGWRILLIYLIVDIVLAALIVKTVHDEYFPHDEELNEQYERLKELQENRAKFIERIRHEK